MKKRLLPVLVMPLLALLMAVPGARGQAVLLSENFDTYDGTPASIPSGFTITWNDTASSSKSYYFSSGFCGLACNSYKFGVDSATIVTPAFANAGSVSFYLKGNGTYQPNKFKVYESPNGSVWTLVSSIDSIPAAAQTMSLPVNASSTQLKFYFQKDILGYNAGFDDLVVYGPVGIGETPSLANVTVYPSPATTAMTIDFKPGIFRDISIQLVNILGQDMFKASLVTFSGRYVVDVTDFPDGIYLLRLKSGYRETIQRVIVKK